ncbi:MAG: glycosyltransferase, partial [Deltaproteobacteria bacterium]|nr:glycosyltransferase [Deltaproteobacteria bacterium]
MTVVAYALAALCLIWWLLALAVARIALVTQRLEDLPLVDRDSWPSVAVVAPAKDEGAALEPALRSRLRSDYPALRIVVIDDRSEDGTGATADRLAAAEPRIEVVHVTELPPDWLGKLNALQRGVNATDADWLLFSDADVHIAPGTLRRAVHYAEEHGVDLVTAMPHVLPGGLGVNSIHAVFLTFLAPAFDAPRAENPESSFAPAVGAFSLVRRSALAKTPGFPSIRLCVDDDLQLGLM